MYPISYTMDFAGTFTRSLRRPPSRCRVPTTSTSSPTAASAASSTGLVISRTAKLVPRRCSLTVFQTAPRPRLLKLMCTATRSRRACPPRGAARSSHPRAPSTATPRSGPRFRSMASRWRMRSTRSTRLRTRTAWCGVTRAAAVTATPLARSPSRRSEGYGMVWYGRGL